MMPLLKEIFRKEVNSSFSYPFDLSESGLYTISVQASCKPGWRSRWWLSFKGLLEDMADLHLDDEDLRIEIDDLKFGKPHGRRGLFNSPAAFSGTKTLGKMKTVVFLVKLNRGSHQVRIVPQRSAYLEEIIIEKIIDPEKVEFHPEVKAENENYYSWYAFVLIEQPLRFFSIIAQAGIPISGKDDDDLKLVIDGEIRRNPLSRHKDSFFCGFFLRDKEHSYSEELNLEMGIHYFELYADKTPTLHSVKFTLVPQESENPKTNVRIYRSGPKGENYNRFDDYINEAVNFWNDKFLMESNPPPEPLDANLVKAMIYVESVVGYGSSGGHSAYPDVMQVGNVNDPAIHTLRNDGWVHPQTGRIARESEWLDGRVNFLAYKEANADSPQESIKWGVRWLYHKAQGIKEGGGRLWKSWREAVVGYNGGGNLKYVDEVYRIYKDGTTIQGFKLWTFILFSLLAFGSLSLIYLNQGKFHVYQEPVPGTRDHLYYISVLDGLRINRFAFSRFYDNGQEFNFKDSKGISLKKMKPRVAGEKLFFLSGYLAGYKIANVVSYSNGRFILVKKSGRFGDEKKNFVGHRLSVGNLDKDPEEEIVEESFINYSNAPDELWEEYYDFDGSSGLYEFKELIKTPRAS